MSLSFGKLSSRILVSNSILILIRTGRLLIGRCMVDWWGMVDWRGIWCRGMVNRRGIWSRGVMKRGMMKRHMMTRWAMVKLSFWVCFRTSLVSYS